MPELPLTVEKIVRRLDKCIFSLARAAKRPYSVTSRLCCKTEKADGKTPDFKGQLRSSPFAHEVSEWDKKLLLWSGRYKKREDIPQHISAKMMSATRSKLRVRVAYFAMAFLLVGFVSAVLIGKQDVKKYRSLRYMHISNDEIEETAKSTSAKP
ncbi:protein FAM162A [Erythrolamprus reginae]|uniref:protein FAM162A n=1 Tax=Erythrolamprus reginae TaxID=121349 RepID=UPI00396CBFD0